MNVFAPFFILFPSFADALVDAAHEARKGGV